MRERKTRYGGQSQQANGNHQEMLEEARRRARRESATREVESANRIMRRPPHEGLDHRLNQLNIDAGLRSLTENERNRLNQENRENNVREASALVIQSLQRGRTIRRRSAEAIRRSAASRQKSKSEKSKSESEKKGGTKKMRKRTLKKKNPFY